MIVASDNHLPSLSNQMNKQENKTQSSRDLMLGNDLWSKGLICAFEYVQGHQKLHQSNSGSKIQSAQVEDAPKKEGPMHELRNSLSSRTSGTNLAASPPIVESTITARDSVSNHCSLESQSSNISGNKSFPRSYWMPIGWARISELVKTVQVDAGWALWPVDVIGYKDDVPVADLAAPYWERPAGPTWWCHVDAGNPFISSWLNNAQWLHPAINLALRDESKLISERMKHLLYEVPVRVAGGLLFELLGQSVGDPFVNEDDLPIVLRSWQTQNFLVTALHVKGFASNVNVLGITEVQELLTAGGNLVPQTVHELIAQLASHLARWDDRLFRKYVFGAADEVELKFMNRRNQEDLQLFTLILNQEIRRLSTQVIRVKWSLHAREEIVFELLQHLRGNSTRFLLEGIRKSTREMIEEQEAARSRLFTIQDVMQSTVRAWLQDKSLTVTHNLGVFGGCGVILSIITGLFGINVDGIPGAGGSPYGFVIFSVILFLLGVVLIVTGLLYLGLKNPVIEEDIEVRKLELEELVRMFEQEAESHAQVRKTVPQTIKHSIVSGMLPDEEGYILVS